jgi:hypothetical protein
VRGGDGGGGDKTTTTTTTKIDWIEILRNNPREAHSDI